MRLSFFNVRAFGTLALAGVLSVGGGCASAGSITTQQEAQLGRQSAAEINRQLPIVGQSDINQYINQIGNQIASNADTRGLRYNFYVVNSSAVNAFALPGGYIYVNRGLIERADNVSELAGVLAHEIAHVTERHGVEQWARAQNANTGVGLGAALYTILTGTPPPQAAGAAVQVGGGAYLARHGREAEREADMKGIEFMTRAGYNPRGMVTFFQELLQERKRNPSRLEQWFSTHPLTEERIANTGQAVQAIPQSRISRTVTDTRGYQQFRSRVRSLPAAPTNR